MKNMKIIGAMVFSMAVLFSACKTPALIEKNEKMDVPASFSSSQDTTNSATMVWKTFFTDSNLVALIDTALHNNQELNITLQEIRILRNEVSAKKGEYLPFARFKTGVGAEKVGRYTSQGANDANTEIKPGVETPELLPDYLVGVDVEWEVDVWHKLRNAKKAAVNRYLASAEGRNFMVTNLVAEIAHAYYELIAYDNQLEIVQRNITIQNNALKTVRLQKESARVTELAIRRFEAQVFSTKSLQFEIQQKIIETENRINFLLGRFPQPVVRSSQNFTDLTPQVVFAGLPSQLLENRPDIKQAELELAANKLDVKAAKAQFYPSVRISSEVGLNAFNPNYIVRSPESLLYGMAGDLVSPLINRRAIKAAYLNANAKQIQSVYNYQQTILNAYIEVVNQMALVENLNSSYELKAQQVQALSESTTISTVLFKSARADYMEVLLTQRDALESKFDLVETKMRQMNAFVSMYQVLGGGWR